MSTLTKIAPPRLRAQCISQKSQLMRIECDRFTNFTEGHQSIIVIRIAHLGLTRLAILHRLSQGERGL